MRIQFRYISITLLLCTSINIQASYDYFSVNRQLVRNGMQAVLMCNGLYTSHRQLGGIFEQELAYLAGERFGGIVGDVDGGDYKINSNLRSVAVGGGDSGPIVSAVFRAGIGCVVMAPDQSENEIDSLPKLELSVPDHDPDSIAWPVGDLISDVVIPDSINIEALQAASDWAFKRPNSQEVTTSLVVVYQGQIIHERYADGFDRHTRTRTWSTAKSIASTLIGILVDRGKLQLDEPLDIDWLPVLKHPEADPRNAITLRHTLHMSSGLYPVDDTDRKYTAGSSLAYWAGASSIDGMRDRGLVRQPGTYWDYENFDTLLAVYATKKALDGGENYRTFPQRALLEKIGMRSTLVGVDRFGDFILSSQVYTNTRDLARFGLLYAQDGMWQGERIISQEWISFVRTPAPTALSHGGFYGGHWWLVPEGREDVPASAYATAGTRGQFVIVVPTLDLVIVRRGLDYSPEGFDYWDLLREVAKAVH